MTGYLIKVVISGGSGVTVDVFSDVPPLSDEPGLAADVLNLLLAAGQGGGAIMNTKKV